MNRALLSLMRGVGIPGAVSLALLAAALMVQFAQVVPMRERSAWLTQELRAAKPSQEIALPSTTPQAQLAAFYAFFEHRESPDIWLAKLYGVASAAGLDWRTADYRLSESRHRLERYQINLPVSGSYSQIRTFLERALIEIPIASLDHISFRRKEAGDPRVDAEVVLTLHLLLP